MHLLSHRRLGYTSASPLFLFASTLLAPLALGQEPDQTQDGGFETVYYDFVDTQGRLAGGQIALRLEPVVTQFKSTVTTDNRIDLVTVGDGYTSTQLGLYASHADNAVAAFFAQEPFARYSTLFRVHRIDVVSAESGVDNDPTQGISRNTAMDMGFWCSGIERLLCINVSKAYNFAGAAPDVDQILAVANSTKYGGAGYSGSELATVAGGNGSAVEIAVHEFGHSIGNLADEYDYGDGTTYTGTEPSEPNVSKLTAAQMSASGTKWAAWLGTNNSMFDGLVSTYEGAYYKQFGVYRPTSDSKMRSLGRPFNLPSVEALIIEMYKTIRPIDDSTPTSQTLIGNETVFVDPIDPVGNPLAIQWSLDGSPIDGATGTTLDLASLSLAACSYELSVKVTDNTSWVRNESARTQWMQQSLSWSISSQVPGDIDCDGDVDMSDFGQLQFCLNGNVPQTNPACTKADLNHNGYVDSADVALFLQCLTGPNVPGNPSCAN